MRFLLISLLIACATSDTFYKLYDITCNSQYKVDIAQFPSGYIPKGNFYFRVAVENADETILEIRLSKGDKIDLKVKVSGFHQLPTEYEIVNGTDIIELEQREISTDNYNIIYTYVVPTLKKQYKIKYLAFTILNNEPLQYLSILVYSNGMTFEYTLYNIDYKKEKIFNETTLSQHKGIFFFLLENEDLEKNKIVRVKLDKEYPGKILIEAAGFKEKPIPEETKPVEAEDLSLKSRTSDENYTVYEFSIEDSTVNKQKYIAIAVLVGEALNFKSFYIGPET